MIGLATKAQNEVATVEVQSVRQAERRRFWAQLLSAINAKSELFRGVGPQSQGWISASSGVRGLGFNFGATGAYARVELHIDRGYKTENEQLFDALLEQREVIEKTFGEALSWERLEARRACRVKSEREDNVFDEDRWGRTIDFLVLTMIRFEAALRTPLNGLRSTLIKHA